MIGDNCNLKCTYCFYNKLDQEHASEFGIDDLRNFFKQIKEMQSSPYRFIWHGGEPLLKGFDTFQEIVKAQTEIFDDYNDVENLLQTNATLVTKKWAVFFRENNFKVGISLDGDKESNDNHRIYKHGQSSFMKVIRGIEILKEEGIEPAIIQTVPKRNLKNVSTDFDFFFDKLQAKSLAINISDVQYTADATLEAVTPDEGFELYKTLFHKWLERKDKNIRVREIENFLLGLTGNTPKSCSFNGTCGHYISIEGNKDVYPCDRLSFSKKYYLGNLNTETYKEILEGERMQKFRELVTDKPEPCKTCEWQKMCNNGCTALRNPETNHYKFCEARKKTFAYISNYINTVNQ